MDDLKEGIHLRAYGQKDPIVEYKTESFNMFVELLDMVGMETLNLVFKLFPQQSEAATPRMQSRASRPQQMTLTHASSQGMGFHAVPEPAGGENSGGTRESGAPPAEKPQPIRVGEKTGRNDPCPCGSGKKYKNCHGK